jgi:transcriptional activator SPT7
MSLLGSHPNFPPSGSHGSGSSALLVNGILAVPARSRTPNQLPDYLTASQLGNAPEAETSVEEDPRTYHFNNLYAQTEAKLHALFGREDEAQGGEDIMVVEDQKGLEKSGSTSGGQETTKPTPKKAARTIEDDDYDDSDEDDESVTNASPLKSRSTGSTAIPRISSPSKPAGMPSPAPTSTQGLPSQWQGKSSDDVRKKLEEDKKAAEDAAKRRFHTVFYPVTNDRDAMLEQQKLEESDRQVDVELSGHGNAATANATEGSLSQANLGASSLVLKHLIARIDAKRDQVQASDQELRALMIEVKKNRSKWASEDKVGQEELYEAAEKVLSEIKAITEHSQPFLQRVNKRDAPDYYTSKCSRRD